MYHCVVLRTFLGLHTNKAKYKIIGYGVAYRLGLSQVSASKFLPWYDVRYADLVRHSRAAEETGTFSQ